MKLPHLLAILLLVVACSPERTDSAASTTATPTTASTTTDPESSTPVEEHTARVGCAGPLDAPVTHRYRDDVGETVPHRVSLDVHRREGATGCPAILWVHGGGWRGGDKQGRGTASKAALAGEVGAVLIAANHRLLSEQHDVRWPAMADDVAAALSWVIDHAAEIGVDPTRVTLMGHSSGAHLVSLVATDPELLAAHGTDRGKVRCLVPIDTAAYLLDSDRSRRSPLIAATFGDDPEVLAAASPTVQALRNPVGLPETLIVTRGRPARIAEASEFADAVSASGAQVRVVHAADSSHAEVNTELGAADEELITPPTLEFLRDCLG